jgi:uncharacterized protein YegP (UPF0339 family)
MAARFEVHDSRDGQFYAVFRAANNQVVWTTETYRAKQSAIDACYLIKREGGNAQVFDHTQSAQNSVYR